MSTPVDSHRRSPAGKMSFGETTSRTQRESKVWEDSLMRTQRPSCRLANPPGFTEAGRQHLRGVCVPALASRLEPVGRWSLTSPEGVDEVRDAGDERELLLPLGWDDLNLICSCLMLSGHLERQTPDSVTLRDRLCRRMRSAVREGPTRPASERREWSCGERAGRGARPRAQRKNRPLTHEPRSAADQPAAIRSRRAPARRGGVGDLG
jgi:hypothetical protein